MKRVELELEHSYKNKFVGRHVLKENSGTTVLGSSREAQIRLLGEEVSGVHAIIDYENGVWTIADAGSEQGTWVKKKPIVSEVIKGDVIARIGGHIIKVSPKTIESDLFKPTREVKKMQGDQQFHQVVTRRNGIVIQSELLESTLPYKLVLGGKEHLLPAPQSSKWVEHDFANTTVQQRLVNSEEVKLSFLDRVGEVTDPELRAPFGVALILLLIISILIGFAPNQPTEELAELKEPQKNKYTRIIYDAKSSKKRREVAQKSQKEISRSVTPAASSNQVKSVNQRLVTETKSQGQTPKVVSKLKNAGLKSLIGKISKRASRSATFIRATGKSPDESSSRTLASVGSVSGSKDQLAGNGGETFKVKGVGTLGKGGASSSYKGTGGLAVGSVGNSSVGVLEEETEIEGGLDRDAIARVINAQLGQIRYCYERQLSASPELYGKVLVKFTIDAAGLVASQSVGLSTLKSAMVEGCMLRRIAGWRFPMPKGGTSVLVTYPFLFKSSN